MESDKDFEPIPLALFRRCYQIVSTTHRRRRMGDLGARMRITATGKDNMVALALIPAGLQLMGSIRASFQLRVYAWIAGAILIVASILFTWWILLALAVVGVVDRWMVSSEKGFWVTEASILLALDILRDDFAGWGSAFPDSRDRAIEIAGDAPLDWLDYYLPRRANLSPEVIHAFGPTGQTGALP